MGQTEIMIGFKQDELINFIFGHLSIIIFQPSNVTCHRYSLTYGRSETFIYFITILLSNKSSCPFNPT